MGLFDFFAGSSQDSFLQYNLRIFLCNPQSISLLHSSSFKKWFCSTYLNNDPQVSVHENMKVLYNWSRCLQRNTDSHEDLNFVKSYRLAKCFLHSVLDVVCWHLHILLCNYSLGKICSLLRLDYLQHRIVRLVMSLDLFR